MDSKRLARARRPKPIVDRRGNAPSRGDSGSDVHIVAGDGALRRRLVRVVTSAGLKAVPHASAEAMLRRASAQGAKAIGCVLAEMGSAATGAVMIAERLAERGISVPVIAIATAAEPAPLDHALHQALWDAIDLPFDDASVLDRLHHAMALESRQPPPPSGHQAPGRLAALSRREREVLNLLLAGQSNKQIAFALGLSQRTVEGHRARMMARLGVRNLAQAIILALEVNMDKGTKPGR